MNTKIFKRLIARKYLQKIHSKFHSSPLSIYEFEELHDKLDCIINHGTLGLNDQTRLGSTIVDFSEFGYFKLIRKGCAELQTINKILQFGLIMRI